MIQTMKPTIGISMRMIHHHSRPTILRITRMFQIGMIDFQPASPALVKIIHQPAMTATMIAI